MTTTLPPIFLILKRNLERMPFIGEQVMHCSRSGIPMFFCFCRSCNGYRAKLQANPFSEN